MTEQRPQKKKKFTFQSTVRVIEKRRLAEKLSKEAEFKGSFQHFEKKLFTFFTYRIAKT